jgi:hypothetical protein
MDYKIISDKNYHKFKLKVVESLKKNWKLHGHTQYPLEINPRGGEIQIEEKGEMVWKRTPQATKGQYSQAMVKYSD